MYLKSIKIRNFRLFQQLDLELNAGLNVFVGENNSGKTALIDAIRLTLDTTSSEWTNISSLDFYEDEDHFRIQLKFDNISPQQAAVFVEHLSYEDDGDDGRKSVLYVNLKVQITNVIRRGSRYIRSRLCSGAKAEGPMIEREIREYLSATYLKPLRDAESELKAGRNSRLAQIVSSSAEFVREGANYKELIEEFIKASSEILKNKGLKADEARIDNNLQQLTFRQDRFALAIQVLGSKEFAKMSAVEKERSFQGILQKLSLVLDDAKPLQGLGYNNVLFMATELLLLEQGKEDFSILLIEEPEAHLHPQLQMKFLKFIHDEYSSDTEPKLQTILTTHSPNLASKAPLESIVLMKDANAFPMRKELTKLDSSDYIFLEKFLDVTKSNLFFAKGVLVVEGDAENILLPTIAELLGHPLENYGVSIVNVGSTAYARYAKVFQRNLDNAHDTAENWLDIPVACLRDLDLWPEKADKANAAGIGWKELKEGARGNKHLWLPRTGTSENTIGTSAETKKSNLAEVSGQNVKVFVSDEWTFEYCLIKSGLEDLIIEILGIDAVSLNGDADEKAIQIYKEIETTSGAKTDVAYKLAESLKSHFDEGDKEKRDELLGKLPLYLVEALKHVLGLDDLVIAETLRQSDAEVVVEEGEVAADGS